MSIDRKRLRWNGWGWNDAPDVLGEDAESIWRWMGRTLGIDPLPHTPAVPLEGIDLPPSRLGKNEHGQLAGILSPERVKTDDYERAFHARGKSYHDLLYLRAGRLDAAPDAVVYCQTAPECLDLLRFCAESGYALIPFGGGSSVVGGVNATAGIGHRGIITLDTTLMNRLLWIDHKSLVACAQAGIYGPQLEEALQAEGYTLGHYPQSFEFSTLGGWIAPRGAGHQSNRYGKAEEWLVSAELATPRGLWRTEDFPGSAAGPQGRDLVAGSEGILGIITEASFRIYPVPEVKDYRGYIFTEFAAAVDTVRALMQSGVPTAMIRLSDPDETRFYTALKMSGEEPDPALRICAMLVGLEGDREAVEAALSASRAIIEGHGGMHFGESLGESWYAGRFETPYLRDPMLDRGLGVDTFETSTKWSNMLTLHEAVTRATLDAMAAHAVAPGARGICMSHISHAYRDGASLYFTFAFPRDPGNETGQWLAVKQAASDAIIEHGGTISHHHGVGMDHLPWIEREKGPIGLAAIRAVKQQIDPANILNPGKLLP